MRRPNQRSKTKWQAGSERYDAGNANAETRKSYFCLKRAVLPANKFCGHLAEEHVEYEIHHVADAYRKQQVIGEECFGDHIDSKRFGFVEQRYSCGDKPDDEKCEEVIAYQKNETEATDEFSMRPKILVVESECEGDCAVNGH